MVEFFKILAQRAGDKMMQNPTMQLGRDVMSGNAMQGMQNFAQQQFAPQMQFGRTMMDPNATNEQRVDAALGMTGSPVMQAMRRPEDEEMGQGLRPRQVIQQGQPNYGLLSQMML